MKNPLNHLRRFTVALPLAAVLLLPTQGFAVNKDMVQLQTQMQELQDALARLQQSNDERMGVLKDLVQQSADSVNKMSANMDNLQKQLQAQQEAQGTKVDQVSGQIQSMNDSLDELKARLARLEKLTQDIQNQQQSMSAGMPSPTAGATPGTDTSAQPQPAANPAPNNVAPPDSLSPDRASSVRKPGKPSAGIPATAPTSGPAAPPADELYKTAMGDYMSAKYSLASSEFGDVIKFYPDNPLAGNSYFYQGEIEYRAAQYAAAAKSYDKVLEQYPDNNKVPAAHLHKGEALVQLKQTEAGIREYRALVQRFPNSPEAMQARSKLNGMGVPIAKRTTR